MTETNFENPDLKGHNQQLANEPLVLKGHNQQLANMPLVLKGHDFSRAEENQQYCVLTYGRTKGEP